MNDMSVPWSIPKSKMSYFGRRYPRETNEAEDLNQSKIETDAMPSIINVEKHHIICFFLSIISYIIDVCSDSLIAIDYIASQRLTHAFFTIIPYITGFSATFILSYIWHKEDHTRCYQYVTSLPAPTAVFRFDVSDYAKLAFKALIGPIYWNYNAILFAYRMKNVSSKKLKKYFFCRMVECERDATLLRLVEAFIESAPQMIVQTIIVLQSVHYGNNSSVWIYFHYLSILSSLVSVCWALCCQHRTLRMVRLDKINIHPSEIIIQFLWRFFLMSSRALIIVIAIIAFGYQAAWFGAIHCVATILHLFMFQWDGNKGLSYSSRCLVMICNMFIHMFTPFNSVDGPACWRYTVALLVELIEAELIFYYLWFYANTTNFDVIPLIYTYHSTYIIGIILMIIYYKRLHPSRRSVN
ncbi:unnamed protein product [Auanema sp. JU1783]|nr:unnamed protein product [Auanema sp. JU1783]